MGRPNAVRRALVAGLITTVGAMATLTACGGSPGEEVVAGGGGDPTAEAARDTAAARDTELEPAPPTDPAGPAEDPGGSPVEGLDAAELRAAVAAPVPVRGRTATGPTADRVTLPDGRLVWRVRIPGDAPVRAARATIAVGGVEIGLANPTPTLDAMVAVTTDGAGIVAGAAVTITWEGSEPTASGALEVLS
mgnify:CR=1 FL=1